MISVVIATYNKYAALKRTLRSIYAQHLPPECEVIVVSDGSDDATVTLAQEFPIRYFYLHRSGLRNPGPARNLGYREAQGDIIIAQSDEVEHRTPGTIAKLASRLTPSSCVFAKVENVDEGGNRVQSDYWPRTRIHRSYFFLGALWKEDLYAVGGNDEEFKYPDGGEDRWLSSCLEHRGCSFVFCDDIVGWHYDHPRPHRTPEGERAARSLAKWKIIEATAGRHPWTARTGAWQ